MIGAAEHAKHHPSRFRRWSFRLLAVLLGLSPFLIAEVLFRITNWQPPMPVSDPFVEFQSVRPLFVADADNRRMVTADNRLEYFQAESFAVEKATDEYRIFCVGGSTVQGRPYAIATSFTTWLELALQAADASRNWQVVNCGGVSYASYRLVPIVNEILRHEPDLIILYTGHNEFLEDRSYQAARETPKFLADTYAKLSRLKTLQYLYSQFVNQPAANDSAMRKEMLATEVQALLDYQGGLETYHRDAQWRMGIVQHFEFNLRRMIEMSEQAGVRLILVEPPANLIDCPPFKSQPTAALSAAEASSVSLMVQQSTELSQSNNDLAIELLERTVETDPDNAQIHFQLGSYYFATGRFHEAKLELQVARNRDICPLRITAPLATVIRKVASDSETPCIDLPQKFADLSEGGIPGNNLFFDHVHPSFRGHQVIANQIIDTLQELGIVNPTADWETRREALFSRHWDSLDPVYFARGQQRLDALKLWTQGRAEKLRDRPIAK